MWIIDTARSIPPTAQFDGFDISSAHFPPQEWLPKNVRLRTMDALAPLPEDLVGYYDVVHVARIGLFVQNENPQPLLANFMKMLSK